MLNSKLLEKYLCLSEEILDLEFSGDEEIDKLSDLIRKRGEVLEEICYISLQPDEKKSFGKKIVDIDEQIMKKLEKELNETRTLIENVKKGKLEQEKTRNALNKYNKKGDSGEGVFFDKNT